MTSEVPPLGPFGSLRCAIWRREKPWKWGSRRPADIPIWSNSQFAHFVFAFHWSILKLRFNRSTQARLHQSLVKEFSAVCHRKGEIWLCCQHGYLPIYLDYIACWCGIIDIFDSGHYGNGSCVSAKRQRFYGGVQRATGWPLRPFLASVALKASWLCGYQSLRMCWCTTQLSWVLKTSSVLRT